MLLMSVKWTYQMRWCVIIVISLTFIQQVISLTGPNICMVQQKFNLTKRIKYKVPYSVRTYEWCLNIPPRCTKWKSEMKEMTRLETEERTAEVAECCPGYKMKDVYCVPVCPSGKTGATCTDDCPTNKWGPNCSKACKECINGYCSPFNGKCQCERGWEGESCRIRIPTSTTKPTPKTTKESKIEYTTNRIKASELTTADYTTDKSTNLETYIPKYDKSTETIMNITSLEVSLGNEDLTTTVNFENDTKQTFESSTLHPTISEQSSSQNTPAYSASTTERSSSSLITNRIRTSETLNILTTTETTKSTETTENKVKSVTTSAIWPVTTKPRSKEIWIKPAQKGDTTIPVIVKYDKTTTKQYFVAKKQSTLDPTSRTIIVSIIPTLPHISYKKISMTTRNYDKNVKFITKSPAIPSSSTILSLLNSKRLSPLNSTGSLPTLIERTTPSLQQSDLLASKVYTALVGSYSLTKPKSETEITIPANFPSSTINSMPSTLKSTALSTAKTIAPIISNTNEISSTIDDKSYTEKLATYPSIFRKIMSEIHTNTDDIKTTAKFNTDSVTEISVTYDNKNYYEPIDTEFSTPKTYELPSSVSDDDVTNDVTKLTTAQIVDQTINILTEPEHITDLAEDRSKGKHTMDLNSILSIIGGVMMAIITVAVIVVMMERYIKSKYDGIIKKNNIRFEMNNRSDSPPFVRNIFDTPLPEPPKFENNHYQPISTLDRNLRQFMRPVAVKAISPLMLENFRGILECHYDHLPLREPERCDRISTAPSVSECTELLSRTTSLSESTIDSMKCEAELNSIDPTTSEPLYAEIPCWRPPSQHAVEVLNVNGEAVTEL